ncbi:hypothetical protein Bca4012_084113 [Brassica carinata]
MYLSRGFSYQVATEKCIMAFLCLIVIGVIAIIIVKNIKIPNFPSILQKKIQFLLSRERVIHGSNTAMKSLHEGANGGDMAEHCGIPTGEADDTVLMDGIDEVSGEVWLDDHGGDKFSKFF